MAAEGYTNESIEKYYAGKRPEIEVGSRHQTLSQVCFLMHRAGLGRPGGKCSWSSQDTEKPSSSQLSSFSITGKYQFIVA